MPDLDERLRRIRDIAAPDLWPAIQSREPQGIPLRTRVAVGVAALILTAGSLGFAVWSFLGADQQPGERRGRETVSTPERIEIIGPGPTEPVSPLTERTEVPLPGEPSGLVSTGGEVWVGVDNGEGEYAVVEVDAGTGEILQTVPVRTQPWELAASAEDVWAAGPGALVQHLDRKTGRVTDVYLPLSDSGVMATGQESVWVVAVDSDTFAGEQVLDLALVRIDAATEEILATVPLGDVAPRGIWDIAIGEGAVWLAAPAGAACGTLIKVDATTRVVFAVPEVADAVDVSDGGVWTTCKQSRDHYTLQQLDSESGEVIRGPFDLPVGGYQVVGSDATRVWLTGYDEELSTVLLTLGSDGSLVEELVVAQDLHTGSARDAGTGSVWVGTIRARQGGPEGILVGIPAK